MNCTPIAAGDPVASVPRAPYRRDELCYILDPAGVHGPDSPGETFRVLKEKETAKFGEYRTRRLLLEAWDRLEDGKLA